MATKNIKGLTVEIGGDTTKLGKALEDVNKKSRDLSSELGQINKLLKMDPGNADLLAQKQKVLADAVSNTAKKLEILEEAERQVQEQFKRGEVSEEQVRALQREIIDTTNKLDQYKAAAKETADAVDRLGDTSDGAAKEIDDVADSADKAKDESEELASSLDGTLSTGFKAVTAVAAAASAAIVGCVEASHEYRTAMGKLDTAFEDANFSSETAKDTYKELQSILGETDQAVEAANHLAKLADTEKDLDDLTTALTGVYATFGDSLPIEGLAEASNESAKTGAVTGALADALNWAAEEGETFGVALKDATEENEEWNKAVEEATSAEDYFNLALQECSDEQERQQLITKTLTKMYGKAADQYKKTNKQVIEANKANEEWNETMADVGEELTPAVTEIKKFGTELLKNAKEPLKDVASFLTDKVLPALSNLGKWCVNNIPTIKAGIAGVAAALAVYKTATIAAEVAQKGLKGAIMATEVAQKALNLVQAATPWGLAATAIGAVVTALGVYAVATADAANENKHLTEEELKLKKAAEETAEKLREQRDATADAVGGITSQMGHITSLKDELLRLADSSGKVQETDQARVDFILNELNEALGTEYTMTDGVIQKYGELKKNIDAVIQSKTANALLEASNADYVAAIQAEAELLGGLTAAQKDYEGAKKDYEAYYNDTYAPKMAELEEKITKANEDHNVRRRDVLKGQKAALEIAHQNELAKYKEKEDAYNKAAQNYGENAETIMGYEEAQTAALEGNNARAIELLKKKGASFDTYADNVDQATRDAIDSLYMEAINAGVEAARMKKNFEAGIEGYTKEMVDEAEKGYEDALNEWATAKADAEAVGEDLGSGLSGGMENKRSGLISKARGIVQSIIGAFKDEADSNSPSRKMIDFGEDMGEGTEIGLENSTKDILGTARRQVNRLISTYRDEGEEAGPKVLQSVNERALARTDKNFQNYTNLNASKLDKILAAIERGQVLMLDGDKMVGGTADRMDNTLGQRRALVVRGAV